jgi:hypothetical protein
MSFKKYFSVDEANAFVPWLLEKMPAMQELTHRLGHEFPDVKKAWKQSKFNGGSVQGVDYLRVAFAVARLRGEMEAKGILIKGVENGLADFPSILDGREVLLCWRMPETEIRFWHDLDSGFAGRRPL